MKASSSASPRRARSRTGRARFPLWSGSASARTSLVTRTRGPCIRHLPECTSCCSLLSLLLAEPRPGEHRQESSHPKAPCAPPIPPSPRPQRARCGYFQRGGRSSGSQFTDISKDAAFPRLQLDSASLAQWFCQALGRFALPPALPEHACLPTCFHLVLSDLLISTNPMGSLGVLTFTSLLIGAWTHTRLGCWPP